MRERLKSQPAEEIRTYLYGRRMARDARRAFGHMLRTNRAHVVMLAERGIIDRPAAAGILGAHRDLEAAGADALTLDPNLEDLHYNLEAEIIRRLGPAVGGQMHTGRSRNDLGATLTRLEAREALLMLLDLTLGVRRRLLDLAAEHAGAILTGYTHMQPAQPITIGHYLSGVADALARDSARLERAYEATNRSPLGAGALAATGFPIDRALTAELMGFDGLIEHSLDAVASRDYVAEALAALAILLTTLSRLGHDLQLWCTFEYALAEIGDDVAATSSIMPQKKNPSALEHVKAKASHAIGALAASLIAMKGTAFTHSREIAGESVQPLEEAAGQAEAVLQVLTAVLRSLRFRTEPARERAGENFSTMTELADVLVRTEGLAFRQAHQVVATLVRMAFDRGLRSAGLVTADLGNAAAREVLGRPTRLTDDDVHAALDPARNVAGKTVTGGPAPAEVRRMLERMRAELAAAEARQAGRRQRLADADRRLRELVEGLMKEDAGGQLR